jgi:hypothetical protein
LSDIAIENQDTTATKSTPADTLLIIFAVIGVVCFLVAIALLSSLFTRVDSTPTNQPVDAAIPPVQTELTAGEVAPIVW